MWAHKVLLHQQKKWTLCTTYVNQVNTLTHLVVIESTVIADTVMASIANTTTNIIFQKQTAAQYLDSTVEPQASVRLGDNGLLVT